MTVQPRPPAPRLLVVDDDPAIRQLIIELLKIEGIAAVEAGSGEEALAVLRREEIDLVLLDVNMPGLDGMMTLREARKLPNCPPIVVVTAHGSIDSAVQAVKDGAWDFLAKPFGHADLTKRIRQGLTAQWSRRQRPEPGLPPGYTPLATLMGNSPEVVKLIQNVRQVAATDFTVTISGPTGSGKELVARAIHAKSHRADKPFVPVDCGAIPAALIESELFGFEKGAFTGADRSRLGKFEAAAGGTLFLDEVQNLSLEVQTRFLRALQEKQICRIGGSSPRQIDFRVVAACNQDLPGLVASGQFREDLYHRLNEFEVRVPPLSRRREDIPYLAGRFIESTARELHKTPPRLTPGAVERLTGYPWPGNVRQLRNVIRRAVLVADHEITESHLDLPVTGPKPVVPAPAGADLPLPTAPVVVSAGAVPPAGGAPVNPPEGPADPPPAAPLSVVPAEISAPPVPELLVDGLPLKEIVRRQVAVVEREVLRQVLVQTNGNKAWAARILQIDYKTIQTKVKEYKLQAPNEADSDPDISPKIFVAS